MCDGGLAWELQHDDRQSATREVLLDDMCKQGAASCFVIAEYGEPAASRGWRHEIGFFRHMGTALVTCSGSTRVPRLRSVNASSE